MRCHIHTAPSWGRPPRSGFTIAEIVMALGIVGLALTLVAEVAITSLAERNRALDERAAQEFAANVLESARACPWEKLTREWAAQQRLPALFTQRGWQLVVHLETEKSQPLAKRVTVRVTWQPGKKPAPRPVELVGVFAARTAPAKEQES
jgi:type II secretory pathway pseudopilin PulG